MRVGDVVQILGSLDDDLEVKAAVGVIMAPWKIPHWWEVLTTNHGVIHWPESEMQKVEVRNEDQNE